MDPVDDPRCRSGHDMQRVRQNLWRCSRCFAVLVEIPAHTGGAEGRAQALNLTNADGDVSGIKKT
jgi:hypothetical protein